MNENQKIWKEPLTTNELQRIDLLVDNELSDEERRDLLQRLDVAPDGWRRCSLAFLEAQAWRDSSLPLFASQARIHGYAFQERAIQEQESLLPDLSEQKNSLLTTQLYHGTVGNWLALAVGLLLVFGVGSLFGNYLATEGSIWNSTLAGQSGSKIVSPEQLVNEDLLVKNNSQKSSSSHSQAGGFSGEFVNVLMPDEQGRPTISMQVPAYDAQTANWKELAPPQRLVSPEVELEALEMGQKIRQERSFVPVLLKDGRQGVISLDEVKLVPISLNDYH